MNHPKIDYNMKVSSRGHRYARITIDGVERTVGQWLYWFKNNTKKRYGIERLYGNARRGMPIEVDHRCLWVKEVEGAPIQPGWYMPKDIGKICGISLEAIHSRTTGIANGNTRPVFVWRAVNATRQKAGIASGRVKTSMFEAEARSRQYEFANDECDVKLNRKKCNAMKHFIPEMVQFTHPRRAEGL